jgi:hypothetical protein
MPVAPVADAAAAHPAAIATLDGAYITAGVARIDHSPEGWTALLTRLDQPGVVASRFFTHGLREVIFRLADGREARARIAATTFTAGHERECSLIGLTPLM